MSILFIYIIYINIIKCFLNNKKHKIIISLTIHYTNIKNTKKIINSIIEQDVNKDLFEILVILSLKEFSNRNELPKEIQNLENSKNINFLFIKEKLTNKIRTLITMKKYKNNPIIIVNDKCILPEGWLKMFMNDHNKYPNDAIAASIQYFFGKGNEIIEFSEGFKGEKFGTFNHVPDMIFNFAIISIDLGGILFPENFFQNIFDENLITKTSDISEDFLESAFIIKEDKVLRQSSKIFDYTKYLLNIINYEKYYKNKIKLLQKDKLSFLKIFQDFNESIEKRKKKIIISITSYPKRFIFLPDLMTFITKQNFNINKIIFSIYKEDLKFYDLNISNVQIISTEKNLRSHLKYFYVMKLFRDHAIITLDDDIGYANDTIESLFNSYIENPNVISGRRSHLMTYKNNGELKKYSKWIQQQNTINSTDFNLTLTNVGGSIFPPDILNINDKLIPIIKETITCDDLTLKYFANIKGVPPKWVINNYFKGIQRKLPKTNDSPLYRINFLNNDICINKMNIMINTTNLNNLCVQYRNISTGNTIYLFDIHNRTVNHNILYFDMNAYSYCPINLKTDFIINFGNYSSQCAFKKSHKINSEYKNGIIASCYMNNRIKNLEDYLFPTTKSKSEIIIKIFNYRKILTTIFKNFFCLEMNNCFLIVVVFEKHYFHKLPISINNKNYLCYIYEGNLLEKAKLPILKKYKCKPFDYNKDNIKRIFVSGIPRKLNETNKLLHDDIIPTQFIIYRIISEDEKKKKSIIIIGKLNGNLPKISLNFKINIFYPQTIAKCYMKPNSQYVQSKIYCINDIKIKSDILIENQIVSSSKNCCDLLLINEEALIRIKFLKEDQFFTNGKDNNYLLLIIYISLLIIIKLRKILRKN